MDKKPLYLTARIDLDASGDELPRRFSGEAYSGGLVPDYNLVIDLATARIDQPMHLLFQHNPDRSPQSRG